MKDGMESLRISEQLEKDGMVAVTINGMSMYPMLYNRRDCVVVEKYRGGAVKYDVLLYKTRTGKLVLHRVIKNEKKNGCFIIRGDNCAEREYVPEESVLGVLTEFTRKKRDYTVKDRGYRLYSRFIVACHPAVALKYKLLGVLRQVKRIFSRGN